jgi:hypothetical protein
LTKPLSHDIITKKFCEVTIVSETNGKLTKIPDDVYELLLKYLQRIQFGSVSLVIQNGKVVQIECIEKIRTDKK